jgi:hypothetical protein
VSTDCYGGESGCVWAAAAEGLERECQACVCVSPVNAVCGGSLCVCDDVAT